MGADAMPPEWIDKARFGMRIFGVILIPLTANFQSGVLVYWVSSNAYTLVQTGIMRVPAVRRLLGLTPANHTVLVSADGKSSPFLAAVERAKEGVAITTHAQKPKQRK
jgi:membrane protein insertase Oxa1/YidC/SpoIIIJ